MLHTEIDNGRGTYCITAMGHLSMRTTLQQHLDKRTQTKFRTRIWIFVGQNILPTCLSENYFVTWTWTKKSKNVNSPNSIIPKFFLRLRFLYLLRENSEKKRGISQSDEPQMTWQKPWNSSNVTPGSFFFLLVFKIRHILKTNAVDFSNFKPCLNYTFERYFSKNVTCCSKVYGSWH